MKVENIDSNNDRASGIATYDGTFIVAESATMDITASRFGFYINHIERDSATVIIAGKVTINTTGSTDRGVYLTVNSTFILTESGILDITAYTYGFETSTSAAVTLAGKVTINANRYGIRNISLYELPFTVSGDVTINISGSSGQGIYNGAAGFMVTGKVTIAATGSSSVCIQSARTFTVAEGGTIDITATYRGIYSSGSSANFIVAGKVTITGTGTYGIYNYVTSTFTVAEGGIIDISNCGIYNYSSAIFIVNGAVVITTDGTAVLNNGTLEGTGTITVNGSPYSF